MRWLVAALCAFALLTGCEDDVVEPVKSTKIASEADYRSTRDAVQRLYDQAVAGATTALDAGELRGDGEVGQNRCDEVYPDRFQKLTARGSVKGTAASIEEAADAVAAEWEQQGWDIKGVTGSGDPDVFRDVVGTSRTPIGVTITVRAKLQIAANDPRAVSASIEGGTGCLELPESVVD